MRWAPTPRDTVPRSMHLAPNLWSLTDQTQQCPARSKNRKLLVSITTNHPLQPQGQPPPPEPLGKRSPSTPPTNRRRRNNNGNRHHPHPATAGQRRTATAEKPQAPAQRRANTKPKPRRENGQPDGSHHQNAPDATTKTPQNQPTPNQPHNGKKPRERPHNERTVFFSPVLIFHREL